MKLYNAAPRTIRRAFGVAARWPVASQQQARRNALVASTALAARRAELLEVEDFLGGLAQVRQPVSVARTA